jgi:hypothetical protein
MTFLHRRIGMTAVGAALGLAPLAQAHADVVTTVFDSAVQSWSATSANSSTSGAATTIQTTDLNPSALNTDYFNLGSAVHTGSGIWTLTTTVTWNGGFLASGGGNDQAWGGFGNITSTADSIGIDAKKGGGTVNTGAPYFIGLRDTGGLGNAWQTTVHSGAQQGAATLNGAYSAINLTASQIQAIEPQTNSVHSSDTQTYQLILNTNNSQWTAKFLVNGVAEQFTVNGTTTDTLVYATDPTITGFGIGATGIPEDQYVFDHTTLTQDVSAVPEPSTWAMMVAGFAGLGFLSYRRTRRNGGSNFRFA